MFRIFSLVITILCIILVLILFLGYTTNPSFSSSVTFEVQYRSQTIWQQLLNFKEIPNRKSDVESIEVLEEYGKLVAWKENLKNGGYRIYRTNQMLDNKKLVIELTESSYGLAGIWTFELEPDGNVTWVTISEESTLTDLKRRGYRRLTLSQDHDLQVWQRYVRSSLIDTLLITP